MASVLQTAGAALAAASARLAAAGIDSARLDARLLLAQASGRRLEQLVARPEQTLDAEAAARFDALIARRARREPMAQILGRREFWSLSLTVTRDTLTPRPESETVVEAALKLRPDRTRPLRVLDLGTGTGCLLLALLSEYGQALGFGTDLSEAALRVAIGNAQALGLSDRARFLRAVWDTGLDGTFDLIVSNPPYIADAQIAELAPEVGVYEPRLALAGGADGLDAYRALAPRLRARLMPGGLAILEIGVGQVGAIEDMLRRSGLKPVGRFSDLGGIERCVAAVIGQ